MTSAAPWELALALSAAMALLAWRVGSLRIDGAIMACGIGASALCVSWSWGAYLIMWFVLASTLSRIGRARKVERTREVVVKGDQRDARQVLANGGVFGLCALTALILGIDGAQHRSFVAIAAAASLAASGADTWSTEIGTLLGGAPWSVRTWRHVPPGTSGAITIAGSVAGLVGAAVLAGIAASMGMLTSSLVPTVAIGGAAGAMCDTLLGAFVQERRHCLACALDTEQHTHRCGTATSLVGGMRRLDNDLVNLLCSLTGALVALAIAFS